jgi:hypothetical protein
MLLAILVLLAGPWSCLIELNKERDSLLDFLLPIVSVMLCVADKKFGMLDIFPVIVLCAVNIGIRWFD